MVRRIEEHPRQNQERIVASWLWRNLPVLPGPCNHRFIYLCHAIFLQLKCR